MLNMCMCVQARFPTAPLPDCDELTPDMIVDQLFEELNL